MTSDVTLREVIESDLPIFFEQQGELEANRMAAFPAREWDTFMAHWSKILGDETVFKKTILFEGRVAGNMVSFVWGGEREVGYWIGKEYWGKGIATRALAVFLGQIVERPLFAHVAKSNIASIRVLEKCGFRMVGEDSEFSATGGEQVEGYILKLDESKGWEVRSKR
jgi:RimJ/RimL family protein N-acetyltransferase